MGLIVRTPRLVGRFLVCIRSGRLAPAVTDLATTNESNIVSNITAVSVVGSRALAAGLAEVRLKLTITSRLRSGSRIAFSLSGLVPVVGICEPTIKSARAFALGIASKGNRVLRRTVAFISMR